MTTVRPDVRRAAQCASSLALLLVFAACAREKPPATPPAVHSPLVGHWHSVTDTTTMSLLADGTARLRTAGAPQGISWRGEPAGESPESICLTVEGRTKCTPIEFRGDSLILNDPTAPQMFARTR